MEKFGRYKIIKKIGEGGTATVHLAKDTVLGDVVLKIMSDLDMPIGIDHEKLLIDEARRTIELHHKNIVRVHTAVEKSHENENAYIVMEYLSGGTLKDRITKNLPYSPVKVLREIASALDYCYQEKGIIHRDLKPTNILFRESSTGELSAVLTDFGISKNQNDQSDFTSIGLRVGTPKYMSPEQFYGESLTQQSDLYSLGIILYEMLVGSVPYKSTNTTTIIKTITKNERPKLPKEHQKYQPIIDNLLSALPEERFLNARKLIDAIDKIEKTPDSSVTNSSSSSSNKRTAIIAASLLAITTTGGITAYILSSIHKNSQILELPKPSSENKIPSSNNNTILTRESAITPLDEKAKLLKSTIKKINTQLSDNQKTGDLESHYALKELVEELIGEHPGNKELKNKLRVVNDLIVKKELAAKRDLNDLKKYKNNGNLNKIEQSLLDLTNNTLLPDETKTEAKKVLSEVRNKKKQLRMLKSAVSIKVKHPLNKEHGVTNPESVEELSTINLHFNYPSFVHCAYQSPDGHIVRLYPIPKTYKQLTFMKIKAKHMEYGKLGKEDTTTTYKGESSIGIANIICFASVKPLRKVIESSFTLEENFDYVLNSSLKSLETSIAEASGHIYHKSSFKIHYK